MQHVEETEVLVIGAGPVGLTAAILLAKNGIQVRVIDREQHTATHSNACVLHPGSLEVLQQARVVEEAERLGNRIHVMRFFDRQAARVEVAFAECPGEFRFPLVLKQGVLEQLLERELQQNEHVKVDWNYRLEDLETREDRVVASIEVLAPNGKGYVVPEFEFEVEKNIQIHARYVIGADGHNSLVRQKLNIECNTLSDPELFVVYNAQCDRPFGHEHEIRIILEEGRTGAMWPFSNKECRWGFQWLPADEPGNYPDKDRDSFLVVDPRSKLHLEKLLRERAPWFDSGIKEVEWATDIQFEHWLVGRFGRERCWLAGDAAHQTGPVGMQSMNAGLREAADLADRLKQILREGALRELLNEYDHEHRAEWLELLRMKDHLEPMAGAEDWVREQRAQILASLPASGPELAHLLHQLGLEAAVPQMQAS